MQDQAMDRQAGVSPKRERFWGILGGTAGSLVGIGGFLVAWLIDGAPLASMGGAPLPPFMYERHSLAIDHFWFVTAIVGGVFLTYGLLQIRIGPHPRSDGYGSVLIGGLLTLMPAMILYFRLTAVVG